MRRFSETLAEPHANFHRHAHEDVHKHANTPTLGGAYKQAYLVIQAQKAGDTGCKKQLWLQRSYEGIREAVDALESLPWILLVLNGAILRDLALQCPGNLIGAFCLLPPK